MSNADRRCAVRLALFALFLYLLTMPGQITSGDGEAMYQTTKSMVGRRSLAIPELPEARLGVDGHYYSKYGLGISLVQAPLYVVGHAAGRLAGAPDDRIARFTAGMVNSFASAALVVVFWLCTRALGCSRRTGTAAALTLGVATIVWPYAAADFTESLASLSLLAAMYCLLRWKGAEVKRAPVYKLLWPLAAGTAAAFAVATKVAAVVLLPIVGGYLLWSLWRRWSSDLRRAARGDWRAARWPAGAVLAFALPLVGAGLALAWVNLARFGDWTEFGYGLEPHAGFTTPVLDGISYLLLSSGKSLFLYAPPLALAVAGAPMFWRRHRAEAAVVALVFLVQLLYYARWWAWHGDWAWGPRYLVLPVPFLMLWSCPLFEWLLREVRRAREVPSLPTPWHRLRGTIVSALAGAIILAGVWVALLGTAIDYGAYYSVVGSQLGHGVDVGMARVVPAFSPILGHWWLFRATVYDSAIPRLDRTQNPLLPAYPWAQLAAARPQLRPEHPEWAVGWRFWFAGLRDRTPLAEFWSAIGACWLAVALIALGRSLWRAADGAESIGGASGQPAAVGH